MLKVFSYDLGSNSIGWSYVERPERYGETIEGKLVDCGVRIFPEAITEKGQPKNVSRRRARLMRRVIQRRARRKRRLEKLLIRNHLLPTDVQDPVKREAALNDIGDPYYLRSEGLDRELEPFELGRAILHIGQRRGFLSNRKTLLGDLKDDPDITDEDLEETSEYLSKEQKKDETAFKKAIAELKKRITDSDAQTLGRFLYHHLQNHGNHARNRDHAHEDFLRTDRSMYQDELDKILEQQKAFHPALSDKLVKEVKKIIFHQRPLRLKKDRIGKCTFEKHLYRCAAARLEAQRFRILCFINNLKYYQDESGSISLNQEQRDQIFRHLERNPKITISTFRKMLGMKGNTRLNYDTKEFNDQAKGNTTSCAIGAVLPCWHDWEPDKQKRLVEDLISLRSKKHLRKRLEKTYWQFPRQISLKLCLVTLDPGHANLSLKAINKLLPHLSEGKIYSEACSEAGYHHSVGREYEALDRLPAPSVLPNPILNCGLSELRRVVNAMIAEFGKPDVIHLELARDITLSKKRKEALNKQNAKNAERNQEAEKEYGEYARTHGLPDRPRREDKIKYRLWEDQRQRCAYSGCSISVSELFSASVEVDHILPYSRSLDDSYMNKVVCFANENRKKGQQTPIDAFGGDDTKWNDITQSIKEWDKSLEGKIKRFFYTEEQLKKSDFTKAHMVNTQYFAREAHDYLEQLGEEVIPVSGRVTAWLRGQWGLNRLLGDDAREKSREDHRHHIVDSFVVAFTNRSLYQHLVRNAEDVENRVGTRYKAPMISEDLTRALEDKLKEVVVSHAVSGKIIGALHEETGRGYNPRLGISYSRSQVNKDLNITRVIDPAVRQRLTEHLDQHGGDKKAAFARDKVVMHKDGRTPIYRARVCSANLSERQHANTRLEIKDAAGRPFRWMVYGNTHCVEIWKRGGKIEPRFITTWKRAQQVRNPGRWRKEQQDGGAAPTDQGPHHDDAQLLMTLYKNDTVICNNKYYRVQNLELANKKITLREIREATLHNKDSAIAKTAPTLINKGMRKVRINVLGRVDDQAHC